MLVSGLTQVPWSNSHSWVPASTLCLSLYLISKLWSTFLSSLSSNYKGNILLILVCLLPMSRILTWALIQRAGPCHLVDWFFWCWIRGYYQDPLRYPYSSVFPKNFPQETSCKLPAVHSFSRLGVIRLHLMLVAFLVRTYSGPFPHYLSFQRADKIASQSSLHFCSTLL